MTRVIQYTTGTRSNFMIGLPFADSELFMAGITTPATVRVQLIGQRLTEGVNARWTNPSILNAFDFAQPVGIFIQDAVLRIRSIPLQGRPQLEITLNTVEQIRSGVV